MRMMPWMGHIMTTEDMVEMKPLWRALYNHAGDEFPEWFLEEDKWVCQGIISSIENWYPEYEKLPRSLLHNDFNPRNVGFRRDGDELTLCAYDWELATIGAPQRDLVEMLSFTLQEHVTKETVNEYVEYHRTCVEKASNSTLDPDQWVMGYRLALQDFTINRVCMYLMAHTFRNYKFLERVIRVLRIMGQFARE